MNTIKIKQTDFRISFFAAVTIVAMISSTIPVAFFIANAAATVYGPDSQTITGIGGEYSSGIIDASGFENLVFTFDYDSTELDGTNDSFTYGWRDAEGDNDLGTVIGEVGETSIEINSVSIPLPALAQVSDLELYVYVTAVPGGYTDQVFLTNIIVEGDSAPVTCTPQHDAAGVTNIQNSNSGDYFDTVNEALADCDTDDGDTIELFGDISVSEQITLDRPITLDGGGFTIDPIFAKTDNSNNSAIGVQSDDVVIQNVVIDGANGTDLHGINVYQSTNVLIKKVTSKNNQIGIVVNGSEVTTEGVTTSGNLVYAINADNPNTQLTLKSVSSHGEFSQIYVDHPGDVVVVDEAKQYAKYPITVTGGDLYVLRGKAAVQDSPLPPCMADVEARVVLRDGEGIVNIGTGNLNEKVFLGNGAMVAFGDWFNLSEAGEWIVDEEMADNFSDPSEKDGLFVSREGRGLVKVALYGFHEKGNSEALKATIEFNDGKVLSFDEMFWHYQLEDHSTTNVDAPQYGFDGVVMASDKTFIDFDFWTGTGGDGISITLDNKTIADCGDDTDPEAVPVDVCENIEGIQASLLEDYEFESEGMCVPIIDIEPVLGCTDPEANNYNQDATDGNNDAVACEYPSSGRSSSGGGSSGTRVSRLLPQPTPQVLGASTNDICPFLLDYMQMGVGNDSWEVTKLQLFLNIFVTPTPITGIFGKETNISVKTFQEKYRTEVLDPWFERGIVPHSRPTGFVYKTTLWKINSIVCPDSAIEPVFEGEDLNSNIVIN